MRVNKFLSVKYILIISCNRYSHLEEPLNKRQGSDRKHENSSIASSVPSPK